VGNGIFALRGAGKNISRFFLTFQLPKVMQIMFTILQLTLLGSGIAQSVKLMVTK
jgi:hypothetical protein